jgi:Type II secretion system (T2SS), protein E, N-terminal domain
MSIRELKKQRMLQRMWPSCFSGSHGGGEVERASGYSLELVEDSQLALVYIQASQRSCLALHRATRRIRRTVRRSDNVLLHGTICLILLPATLPEGAQVVARRIYILLADVEFELQIIYDRAAFALMQRLQAEHLFTAVEECEAVYKPVSVMPWKSDQNGLPYLAFLGSYPPHRLLHLFPYDLARRHRCVPIGAERGVLTLATCKQLDQDLISHFHDVTQHNIFQVRCEVEMIEDVLKYWKNAICFQEDKSTNQHA